MCLLVQAFHFAYRWVRFTVPYYADDFSAIPNETSRASGLKPQSARAWLR